MASVGVMKKPYPSCTSRVPVEYVWCARGSGLGRKGYGVYRGLHIFFSFGVCAVMMVLGGLQSQRLGCCVSGKISG